MKITNRLLAGILTAGVLVLVAPQVAGASASRDVRPVFALPGFTPVAGAQSAVVRLDSGVAFDIDTSELAPGSPATLLLVIFNNPAGCSHGVMGLHCGEGDVVPGGLAQPSVVVGAERTPGTAGSLGAGGSLAVNDVSNALFGPGLTNPSGADVHLVIRQNGANVQASVHEA